MTHTYTQKTTENLSN